MILFAWFLDKRTVLFGNQGGFYTPCRWNELKSVIELPVRLMSRSRKAILELVQVLFLMPQRVNFLLRRGAKTGT